MLAWSKFERVSRFFQKIEFENFGPIKKASLEMTPLHALIGPNDSGKTTPLKGIRFIANMGQNRRFDPDDAFGNPKSVIQATADTFWVKYTSGGLAFSSGRQWPVDRPLHVRSLRLDPDSLRKETGLIATSDFLDFQDERGTGLGALLDAVFASNVQNFLELQEQLKETFPSVAGFRLWTTGSGRRIGVRLKNGAEILPERMSEGMLYFLAFAILPFLSPSNLLLIEEPENGLHPSRIAEVMALLRKHSEKTQIVIATHSPLVVNALQPEEVTLVRRTEDEGTTYTPISKTPNFERRSKVYALGELWLSYADGKVDSLVATGS